MVCCLSPGEALESLSEDLTCCLLQLRRRPRAPASALAIAVFDNETPPRRLAARRCLFAPSSFAAGPACTSAVGPPQLL